MKKGFPRPWSEEFEVPTPYTAVGPEAPAINHDGRNLECLTGYLCSVCGTRLGPVCKASINKKYQHINKQDPGFMHEKCAAIALNFCPAFKSEFILIDVTTIPSMQTVLSYHQSVIPRELLTDAEL